LILSLASLALLFLSLLPPAVASHDKSFWLALRAKAFHLPQSESVLPLALEATVMLGSTDPEVRDSARERDLRGYIVGKGWGHATAHSADLLKFLGRSSRLNTAQQARLVESISGRLRFAGQVFVWGEDARLAAASVRVVYRPARRGSQVCRD
jgi:hypothetical protein